MVSSTLACANITLFHFLPYKCRDAWAGTFHDLVSVGGSVLRTDCPLTLPAVAPLSEATLEAEVSRSYCLDEGEGKDYLPLMLLWLLL